MEHDGDDPRRELFDLWERPSGGDWEGVAAQARRVGAALRSEDRRCLIAAAWVHDIGCAEPLRVLGFHPVHCRRAGIPSF